MDYTLHQLRILLKVAELQSITRAAEALHLTQPAVSIQLRKLQDQFDIPLTEVLGRQLYITDFGKEIVAASQRIMDEVHEIKYKVQAYKGELTGRIRVSVVSTAKYVMPYFLAGFLQDNPGVDLDIDVTNKAQVVQSLEQNEVDFALVSVMPQNLEVDKVTLMQNRLYLIGNPEFPFPKSKKGMDGKMVLPFIFREQGSATRQAMERFMEQKNWPTHKNITLTSNEAVKQAVLAGLGFSVMPVIGLKNELRHQSLQIIPMKGLPVTTDWNLIWQKKKKFSPAAAAYLEYVRENKERIIQQSFNWIQEY